METRQGLLLLGGGGGYPTGPWVDEANFLSLTLEPIHGPSHDVTRMPRICLNQDCHFSSFTKLFARNVVVWLFFHFSILVLNVAFCTCFFLQNRRNSFFSFKKFRNLFYVFTNFPL